MTLTERSPRLSNDQRRILNALYEGDLSNLQMAKVIGCFPTNVRAYMKGLVDQGLVRKIGEDWRAV